MNGHQPGGFIAGRSRAETCSEVSKAWRDQERTMVEAFDSLAHSPRLVSFGPHKSKHCLGLQPVFALIGGIPKAKSLERLNGAAQKAETHHPQSSSYLPSFHSTMDMLHSLTHAAVEYEALRWLESEYPLSDIPDGSTPGAQTLVDVLEVYPEKAEWKNAIDASALPDLFPLDKSENPIEVKTPKLRVFFLADASFLLERSGDNFRFDPDSPTVRWMQQRFRVSPLFFNSAVLAFLPGQEHVCFLHRDQAGKATRLEGFYQVKNHYEFRKHAVWFSHMLGQDGSSTYITCNFPEEAKSAIVTCSQKCAAAAALFLRPLSIDLFWSQGVLRTLAGVLGGVVTGLIQVEENTQLKPSITPDAAAAAISDLHHSSRELHLLRGRVGDLQVIIQFLATMAQKISQHALPCTAEDVPVKGEMDSIIESLDYQKSQTEHLGRQEAVYHGRITTQIALFYNLSNQLDSRTNLDIARLTSKISISTQRDSSSMITIAILTMFFLPGTFISAFFSMAFVDSTPDARGRPIVIVGPQVWIYAVVTIILTVLVFCIWGLWHNRRIGQQAKELDIENRAGGIQEPNDTNAVAERLREVTRKLGDRVRDHVGRVQVGLRNRWGAQNVDAVATVPLVAMGPSAQARV
ncbi:unnamed protein product [Cyclocybe aegerita]|uniref:Uncharacterized protein n=1 Tax=Cyclocybe aegerita TaxID=1973307 RepID=A0A8S0WH79_CYCAE|nr:unnamed protein product [Cyclocybe aegerita]